MEDEIADDAFGQKKEIRLILALEVGQQTVDEIAHLGRLPVGVYAEIGRSDRNSLPQRLSGGITQQKHLENLHHAVAQPCRILHLPGRFGPRFVDHGRRDTQPQQIHHRLHRLRRAYGHGVVGNDVDRAPRLLLPAEPLGVVFLQRQDIVDYLLTLAAGAHQHTDLRRREAAPQLVEDIGAHQLELLSVAERLVGAVEEELHKPLAVGESHPLHHAVIGGAGPYPFEIRGKGGEERVVEFHNFAGASPVGVVADVAADFRDMVFAERFARLAAQKLGAGVAETVDTLLHIADNQVLAPSRESLLHQRAQIVPVHLRGVLEFVDEQMVELRAHLFVDKGHLPLF